MKGSEYIKIITDQGHLPLLKDMEMPRATRKRLRSRQQLVPKQKQGRFRNDFKR